MSFELSLVSKLIETRDFRLVRSKKISEDFFYDPVACQMFTFIKNHFIKYGEVPSAKVFSHEFPTSAKTLKPCYDALAVVCDKLKEKKLYNDMGEMVKDVMKVSIEDPYEAFTMLRNGVSSLTTYHSENKDIDITKCRNEVLSEYDAIKSASGIIGIPYPWPSMNKITMGIHSTELIVIYARPKSLKTWFMTCMALTAHAHNKRVLYLTKEMSRDQIKRRAVAVFTGVEYELYRSGKLTKKQHADFQDNLEAFEESNNPFIVSQVEGQGQEVIMDVAAKIDEYEADICFFDGVYLCANDWLEIAKLTRGLKGVALEKGCPIVCTTQRNRSGRGKSGGDMSDIAYGDSFGQDADVLMRLHYDQMQEENQELLVTLPGARESKKTSFTINAKVASDFSEKFGYEDVEANAARATTSDDAVYT